MLLLPYQAGIAEDHITVVVEPEAALIGCEDEIAGMKSDIYRTDRKVMVVNWDGNALS